MRTTALVLLLVCSCQWSVNCRVCNDIPAYRYLNDFANNDKCESVDLVFRYLRDMTEEWGSGQCRLDTINNLANHFGRQAHTPDHCQCNGTFKLQAYSTSPNDGIQSDLANFCLQNDNGYREVYNQFFPSHSPHQDLVCRTHHSLWSLLRNIVANNGACQKDIVYHLSYAFSQHGDPCTCSEKHDATTSSSGNDGHHCRQYDSYNALVNLLHNNGCMSANTVWHLLDDLQVKDSTCRKNIQTQFTHSFTNISTDENNGCSCTAKGILTDKQHVHYINNGSHDQCSLESGSTYTDIERDLFTHITNRGCRNHNYLWPTLAGVKDYCEGNNCHMRHVDCTQDLIVRAAIDYPSQESDSCVCSRPNTTTSSTTMTTKTTITTTTSATPETPTPTTATTPDAITSTSQATIATTEPAVSSHADITHVNCSLYDRYSTCEDQTACTYFSNTPWQICGDAAYVAKCPRLCACCETTTTTSTTQQTTTPTTTTTTTKSLVTTTSHGTMVVTQTAVSSPGQWSEWFNGQCSSTCGFGIQHRVRFCSTGQNADCAGSSTDMIPCNEQNCVQTAGQWSEWFNGQCSSTCGFGTQHRVRFCSTGQNADCAGSSTDMIQCNEQNCVQTDALRECNHTCTLYAAGIGTAVVSANATGCVRSSEFASDEALLMACCSLGFRHGWRKGKPVQQTGVCIKGEIPYYTPVSLYNGPAITDNHAGIFVGCIADGQSGFKMIFQDCNTLPTVIFVNGTDVTDPNNYFVIF